MRIDDRDRGASSPAGGSKQRFERDLAPARGRQIDSTTLARLLARTTRATVSAARARARVEALAFRSSRTTEGTLSLARSAADEHARELVEAHLASRLRARAVPSARPGTAPHSPSTPPGVPELAPPAETHPRSAAPGVPGSAARPAEASRRAEELASLIERIETAVKAGIPSLAVSLGPRAQAARIEVRRTGRGEVAVTVTTGSAASAPCANTLRAALSARGLRVRRITVGHAAT